MSSQINIRGFTLIELVMVIVIASIVSLGSVQFISQSVQGVSDAANRQQLASVGWILSEKISRDLRSALPNSIRLNVVGSCIEFVPISAASQYRSVPITVAADRFIAVKLTNYVFDANDRVAVYPNEPDEIYPAPLPGAISPTIAAIDDSDVNQDEVRLDAIHRFITDSPQRRFFVTSDPVTYCIRVGGEVRRYRNYGLQANIEDNLLGEEVIANGVAGSFNYVPATLTRNGVVRLTFTLTDPGSGESQIIDQEVQIRNVP